MNIEAWRKNENTSSFENLTKGTQLTVEGFFKPEEWTDKDGVKKNRIIMVATKFYPALEKEEEAPAEAPKGKRAGNKSCLYIHRRSSDRCFFIAPHTFRYSFYISLFLASTTADIEFIRANLRRR